MGAFPAVYDSLNCFSFVILHCFACSFSCFRVIAMSLSGASTAPTWRGRGLDNGFLAGGDEYNKHKALCWFHSVGQLIGPLMLKQLPAVIAAPQRDAAATKRTQERADSARAMLPLFQELSQLGDVLDLDEPVLSAALCAILEAISKSGFCEPWRARPFLIAANRTSTRTPMMPSLLGWASQTSRSPSGS